MREYDLTEDNNLIQKQVFFQTIERMKKDKSYLFKTELGKIVVTKRKKKKIERFEVTLNKKEVDLSTVNNLFSKTSTEKKVKKFKIAEKGKNSVLLNNRQTGSFYTKERIKHVFEFRDYKTKKERKKLYKELPEEFTGDELLAAINKVFNNPPAFDVFQTFNLLDNWGF